MEVSLRSLQQSASSIFKRSSKVRQAVDKIGKLDNATAARVTTAVASKLIPFVRAELEKAYDASGLKTDTGALRRASATNAVIEVVAGKGFLISMARGAKYTKRKGNVYAAAFSHKYGAVRQPLTKAAGSLYKDLPTREMWARKTAAGEYGAKAKRTLKKVMTKAFGASGQTNFGKGVHFIPPHKPFFTLSKDQIATIQKRQAELVKAELNRIGVL
jgi:hypothetical protein